MIDNSHREHADALRGPPMDIPLPEEVVTCLHAEHTLVSIVGDQFAVIAMRNQDAALYVSVDPCQLRDWAANLIRAADFLDGGRGRN